MNYFTNNKIILGNCIEEMDKLIINGILVDLTVTSPPYDNLRNYNKSLEWNENIWKLAIEKLYKITKNGGIVVWVVCDATINGSESLTSFKQALYFKECGFNLHDTMIYEKANISFPDSTRYYNCFEYMFVFSKGKPLKFNPITKKNPLYGKAITSTKRGKDGIIKKDSGYINKKNRPEFSVIRNIWKYANGCQGVKQEHPAVFPYKLAYDHIISWSNKNDVILDPFMGSGTTAIACIDTNRNFIGIEKVVDYYNQAIERVKRHIAQPQLFEPSLPENIQEELKLGV